MLRTILLALAVVFVWTSTADAKIVCKESPGGRSGWSWRQIDGKKCWYKGKPRISKALLAWARPKAPAAYAMANVPLPRPAPVKIAPDDERLLENYWPEFTSFADRFDAIHWQRGR